METMASFTVNSLRFEQPLKVPSGIAVSEPMFALERVTTPLNASVPSDLTLSGSTIAESLE